MNTLPAPSYKRHCLLSEIISHAVWLYVRFALSYRDVEALLAERGMRVMDETIRQWGQTFGQHYANNLRRRCAQTGDTWQLDDVLLNINGKPHSLWRAVDQHGIGLDMVVQSRRNNAAATQCVRK